MDMLEKFNRSFGAWYEGLFGASDDVRPRDILRKILSAMESNRKEGFDNKVYVPNQYILEIDVDDEEEKEYLLSFLNKDELEAAIRRYCQQNHYHIRGTLDFTIKEAAESDSVAGRKSEKVRVRCRYDSKVTAPEPIPMANDHTVARVPHYDESDEGTVPSIDAATLVVYAPNSSPFRYPLNRGAVSIGRSPSAGNELVVQSDGQISKRHARIEHDRDGRYTIYDLASTNGTKVNGRRVENRTLNDGDEITLGETRLTFQSGFRANELESDQKISTKDLNPEPVGAARPARTQGFYGGAAARQAEEPGSSSPQRRVLHSRSARLVLIDGATEVDDFLLASETAIGRGVTNDIVLPDRSIATRHARLCNDGDGYRIETLSEGYDTAINGTAIGARQSAPLKDGDIIGLGSLTMRFESGAD